MVAYRCRHRRHHMGHRRHRFPRYHSTYVCIVRETVLFRMCIQDTLRGKMLEYSKKDNKRHRIK
jgi:hypothetical protein